MIEKKEILVMFTYDGFAKPTTFKITGERPEKKEVIVHRDTGPKGSLIVMTESEWRRWCKKDMEILRNEEGEG